MQIGTCHIYGKRLTGQARAYSQSEYEVFGQDGPPSQVRPDLWGASTAQARARGNGRTLADPASTPPKRQRCSRYTRRGSRRTCRPSADAGILQ